MKYDVIIIGSGLGGLECAYILAKRGLHVLVLEREIQAGGCMQSYQRHRKVMDTGFHYVGGLGEGQSLHEAFSYLNLLHLPWHHLDAKAFDKVTLEHKTYGYAEGFDAFEERLSDYFPKEKEGIHRYTELLRHIGDHRETMGVSAWDYLKEIFHDQELINVISGTSQKMELRKDTLPLFTFAHVNAGFIESSWRLQGGGYLIVNSLVDDLRKMGGEIICRAEVEELIEKDDRIVAAKCKNGEIYEADCFISDIHPASTLNLVKESHVLKRIYRHRISRLENTFGTFTASLVVKPDTIRYRNFNQYVYSCPDVWAYHENPVHTEGVMISWKVPEDGSEYASQIDLLTPVPLGKMAEWEDTSLEHRGDEYKAWKEHKTRRCVVLASKAIPNLRDNIEDVYTSSPLTYRDYTHTPGGSSYGIRKDWHMPMLTELSPKTPIANLLLTGQNLIVHGLQGVTETAFMTCKEIINKKI